MTYNQKVETQTEKILALFAPALVKRKGKYPTAWGNKTAQGLKASIFNILVDLDAAQETQKGGEKKYYV